MPVTLATIDAIMRAYFPVLERQVYSPVLYDIDIIDLCPDAEAIDLCPDMCWRCDSEWANNDLGLCDDCLEDLHGRV